jgi:hypothetical protein
MAKAKIKIDMKQINKFRFWIGLGVLALLLIVLSYFQLTAIGGEKEKKAYAEKLKIGSANIYVRGTNLFTWVKDENLPFDPEQGTGSASNLNVFIPKTVTVGLSLAF